MHVCRVEIQLRVWDQKTEFAPVIRGEGIDDNGPARVERFVN
jgi:hypothetical protein